MTRVLLMCSLEGSPASWSQVMLKVSFSLLNLSHFQNGISCLFNGKHEKCGILLGVWLC